MPRFDVFEIDRSYYAVVQADHLLSINTIVVVPIRPAHLFPALSKLTVEIKIDGAPWRILSHMPLTIDARLLQNRLPAHRLSADEGQKVMDALNTLLWGF